MSYTNSLLCYTIAMCLFIKCLEGKWDTLGCPKMCICGESASPLLGKLLRTVDCSNAHFEIGSKFSDHFHVTKSSINDYNPTRYIILPEFNKSLSLVEQLKLSSNDIEVLPESRLKNLTSLLSLDLSDNKLREIGDNDLEGLTNLLSLNLTKNNLKLIRPGAFKHTPNLQYLYLSHNILNYIHYEWLKTIPNLQQLFAAQNGIAKLKDNTFSALLSLSTLSLADNHLENLSKDTFFKLDHLEHLDLSGNLLNSVPSRAISLLKSLQDLKLDSNPIQIIGAFAFYSLNLGALSVNNMNSLTAIESDAFSSLQKLTNLEISRNQMLVYIAPDAIQDVPKLNYLYLNNNKLIAIPRRLITSLPGLKILAVHGNPLKCDCNIRWLRKVLEDQVSENEDTVNPVEREDDAIERPFYEPYIVKREKDILCSGSQKWPSHMATSAIHIRGQPLIEIPLTSIPSVCPPTVIPLFSQSYNLVLGSSLTLKCHAVGIPVPKLQWILPNRKILNDTSNDIRLQIKTPGTLVVGYIKILDAGTYTCSATSPQGISTVPTVLSIHSKNVHLIFKGIATNFVTVTWKNTDSTIHTSNYVILYRMPGTEETYRKVPIQPYMRAYTFTQLKPQTTYEFCIAYVKNKIPSKINCSQVTTKHNIYVMAGIKSVHNVTVIITICVSAVILTILCISIAVCKNYCRRKSYKDPSWGGGMYYSSTSNNNKDYMPNIPLENLYATSSSTSVPSTPLCTSTTSLISNLKA